MAQMLDMICNERHRMPITTPLAPPRASPPMKSILDACRASLSPSLIDHTVGTSEPRSRPTHLLRPCSRAPTTCVRTCTRTTRPHRRSGKWAQLRPLRCPPPPPSIRGRRIGFGSRTPPPLSATVCGKALTTKFSKRNSPCIGPDPSRYSLLVPPKPPTPLTATTLETSCYTLTSPHIFRALQPNPA